MKTELGKKCIEYRALHNLSQGAFADLCGLDRGTIAKVERGDKTTDLTQGKIKIVIEGVEHNAKE